MLLGFSHSRIFTRQTRVCAFGFIYRLPSMCPCVCVQFVVSVDIYTLRTGGETCCIKLLGSYCVLEASCGVFAREWDKL